MEIRIWVQRLLIKAPWMDEQTRAAHRARLAELQAKADREFESANERRARESAENKQRIAEMEAKLNQPLDKRP